MPRARASRQLKAPAPQSIRRITEPSGDLYEVQDQKDWSRVDDEIQDAQIAANIRAATRLAEDFCLRAFITQSWRITYDRLPFGGLSIPAIPRIIELPRPLLITLDQVQVVLEDDSTSLVSTDSFHKDLNGEPGRIMLKDGVSWPTGLREIDAIRIDYTCGYGDESVVPDGIKTGVKMIASTAFENREDWVVGKTVAEIPRNAEAWLQPFKVYWL